ncbi:MAG: hypothetical protein WAZ18_03130 [Alphaproteobacteria bacterium]
MSTLQRAALELTLPQAMLVLDLKASGVAVEVGDEPFAWLGGDGQVQPLAAAPVRVVEAPTPAATRGFEVGMVAGVKASPTHAKPKVPLMAMGPLPVVPAKVWTVGQGGGLVVVARGMPAAEGNIPLREAEMALLGKMLAAVGAGEVSGWVVLGTREDKARVEVRDEMMAAVKGLAPTRVLVLGGAALGTLVDGGASIDGWNAKPVMEGVAAVGAVFPPDMLLQQPMFKRVAWQHLLNWKQRWEVSA